MQMHNQKTQEYFKALKIKLCKCMLPTLIINKKGHQKFMDYVCGQGFKILYITQIQEFWTKMNFWSKIVSKNVKLHLTADNETMHKALMYIVCTT